MRARCEKHRKRALFFIMKLPVVGSKAPRSKAFSSQKEHPQGKDA